MNGDAQSDLATIELKKGEKLEDFHKRIMILQQKINLSGETISPTRLQLKYMK